MSRQYHSKVSLPKIEKLLVDDERILWIGKPGFRRMMTVPMNDGIEPIVMLLLGLMVTVFVAVIMIFGLAGSSPGLSLGLIVILLLMTFAPLISQYIDVQNTVYAVTTHRALIIKGNDVTSFGAADINQLMIERANDGTGDIIFKSVVRQRFMHNGYLPYPVEVEEKVGFFGIANPRRVYGTLLNTFRTSPTPMWQDAPGVAIPQARKASATA